MDNPCGWWYNAKIIKCLLPPFEEFIPLSISLELSFGIDVATGSDIRVRVLVNGVNNSAIEAGFDLAIAKAF